MTSKKTRKTFGTWQAAFLAAFEQTNNVSAACRIVKYGSRVLTRKRAYEERERNREFREAWEGICQVYIDDLEHAMKDRALHGWLEPVFYQGNECGQVRKFSDTLQIFTLKKLKPEVYGDDAGVESSDGDREYAARVRRAMSEIRDLALNAPSPAVTAES